MNIPDKLPNPSRYEGTLCKKMTKEDWIGYFECREKYDRPMSDLEKDRIMEEADNLSFRGEVDKAAELAMKIPMKPYLAFCLKCAEGLSALKDFNLYEAKQEYPDEF